MIMVVVMVVLVMLVLDEGGSNLEASQVVQEHGQSGKGR